MAAIANRIAKNTTYLSLSSVLQKVLAFGFYIYLASQLGEELLGRYSFALSYTGIFVILMNFGFVPVITRDGAKDDNSIQRRFEEILGVKVLLTAVTLVVMFGIFSLLHQFNPLPLYTVQLVMMAGVIIVVDTFRSVFLAVLRAKQQMLYEAIGQILYQVIVVVGGVGIFMMGHKARAMVIVIGVASLIYLLYAIYAVVAKAQIVPRFVLRRSVLWPLLKLAAPFALADVFFRLNGSIDTVMLEYLAGDRFVAWYNIALKLTVTLTIIPGAFATAFFPAMSKAFVRSRQELATIFDQAMEYLLLLATPISVGAFIMAPTIIDLAFPDFPASTSALRIFMVSVIFLFINYPIGNLLNAANKQTTNTVNMGIALVVNIIINILLIPQYTYNGAAVAAVASSIALVLLGLPHVAKLIDLHGARLMNRFARAGLASAAMGGAVWWVLTLSFGNTVVQFLLPIGVGVGVYAITLLLVKGVTTAELASIKTAIAQKMS